MTNSPTRAARPVARAAAGVLAVGLAAGAIMLPGTIARAAAPENLAVFNASSAATPYGIVSRVPAETAGGMLFSSTDVNLGKAQAMAAGFTLGPLGDLFLVSSAPEGAIDRVPTVITAQEPPQPQSPREATFSGGRSGGVDGEVRNFTLDARADDMPSATAAAAGNAVTGSLFSTGASTSASNSVVEADGTVVTRALTTVHDIAIGAPGAQLTIASVSSLATITIPPGKRPVTDLRTNTYGAQLAGVPVTFDEKGISLAGEVALPASAAAGFNAALQSLADQGIILTPTPRQEEVNADSATLSGAAFTYRYRVPDAFPRPSDIGTDQTFSVASVTATATSRLRGEIGPPQVDAAAPAAAPAPAGAGPAPINPAPAPAPLGLPAGANRTPIGVLAPAPAVAPTVTETEFFLPARAADPLPGQFQDSYQFVLLAAALGVAGMVYLVRTATA